MPSIDRPLADQPLHFRLGEKDRAEFIDEALLARAGRSARTLVKDGPLRVTLVALGAGGELASHRADGPITVQVIAGQIHFRAGDDEWRLGPGELLSLSVGVQHSVESADGGVFLLTVATTPRG